MTKYKILLKKHWKKKDERSGRRKELEPESPDLGDLEVEASHRSLYPRSLRIVQPVNPDVGERIRMYRVISSCIIYSMILSMLYYATTFANTTVSTIRGAKEKQGNEFEAPIVSRKMRTNFTQDEEMSRLSYDAFIHKVEEEINQKKRGRIVKIHSRIKNSTTSNNTLASRKEIGLKAFNRRFSSSSGEINPQKTTTAGDVSGSKANTVIETPKPGVTEALMQPKAIPASGGASVNPVLETGNLHQSPSQRHPFGFTDLQTSARSSSHTNALQLGQNFLNPQPIQTGLLFGSPKQPFFQTAGSLSNQANALMPQFPNIGTSTNQMGLQTGAFNPQYGLQNPQGSFQTQSPHPLSYTLANPFAGANQVQSYDEFVAQLQHAIGSSMAHRPQNKPSFPQLNFSPIRSP